MPEPTFQRTHQIDWRILIDVNTHEDVEQFFRNVGAHVESAKVVLDETAPDSEIDKYARRNGCIVVSHDRRFMKLIQQKQYQRDITASTGYDRILLSGAERRQANRLQEVPPILAMYHTWAISSNRRFVVTLADNWIRFDDKPIARVMREDHA